MNRCSNLISTSLVVVRTNFWHIIEIKGKHHTCYLMKIVIINCTNTRKPSYLNNCVLHFAASKLHDSSNTWLVQISLNTDSKTTGTNRKEEGCWQQLSSCSNILPFHVTISVSSIDHSWLKPDTNSLCILFACSGPHYFKRYKIRMLRIGRRVSRHNTTAKSIMCFILFLYKYQRGK